MLRAFGPPVATCCDMLGVANRTSAHALAQHCCTNLDILVPSAARLKMSLTSFADHATKRNGGSRDKNGPWPNEYNITQQPQLSHEKFDNFQT